MPDYLRGCKVNYKSIEKYNITLTRYWQPTFSLSNWRNIMNTEMTLQTIGFKLSLIERLKGIFTVIIAYIALRCLSLSTICKIVSEVKRLCSREIDVEEADIAWAAVRQSSFFFLGRVACLELSLAFVLFALTKGLWATCCVGVANEPFRAHSWVELGEKPFREPDYVEQDFRRLLAV
jgi:hypothetical protein